MARGGGAITRWESGLPPVVMPHNGAELSDSSVPPRQTLSCPCVRVEQQTEATSSPRVLVQQQDRHVRMLHGCFQHGFFKC